MRQQKSFFSRLFQLFELFLASKPVNKFSRLHLYTKNKVRLIMLYQEGPGNATFLIKLLKRLMNQMLLVSASSKII